MYTHTPTLCNHLLNIVDKQTFSTILGQHDTDKRKKKFSTRETFIWLLVWQATNSASIRDLQNTFDVHKNKMYHLGITSFARSTFSDWINKIPPVVFQQVFFYLLWKAQSILPANKRNKETQKIFAIDSTLVSLTLSVFDWALYRKKKWGIKLHTRLDITNALPDLIYVSNAKLHDSKMGEKLLSWLKKSDILLFDRWYLDYKFLYISHKKHVTFVTRTKKSTQYQPILKKINVLK